MSQHPNSSRDDEVLAKLIDYMIPIFYLDKLMSKLTFKDLAQRNTVILIWVLGCRRCEDRETIYGPPKEKYVDVKSQVRAHPQETLRTYIH